MKKLILVTSFLLLLLIITPLSISAQEEAPEEEVTTEEYGENSNQEETPQKEVKYKAKIVELQKEACPESLGEGDCYFFKLEIISGDKKGQVVESTASLSDDPKLASLNYKIGLKVSIVETSIAGETGYYVKEPLRIGPLTILTIVFILIVILVGRLQGASSLLGLIISFIILRFLVIPLMLSGTDPIVASILGGSIILTTSIFLSHGFNKKTSIALIGTLISLVITALLAFIYAMASRLTGYSTDEATFLIQLIDKPLNMQGILLASLIIGGIGILDDVTVSQVSIIVELYQANPNFLWKELFLRSMKVGRDHIASMVNTLVLAYTGSALPLVMLFIASGASFEEIINFELVAEEIVRTLVGSIGLILAVPITSVLASLIIAGKQDQQQFGRIRR